MSEYLKAVAKEPSDALLIAEAQTMLKIIVEEHVRLGRPAHELKEQCEGVVLRLKARVRNDETRERIDECMQRYLRELYDRFTAMYAMLRVMSSIVAKETGRPVSPRTGLAPEIPLSEDPLSYNMEPAARDHFEAYQKNVRKVLDEILNAEPRPEHEHGVNLRTIAELNVRYDRQMKMIGDLGEQGEDLVWIEPHANCSARCEPWQGKLYSLSGRTGRTEDGISYRPLSDATDVTVTTRAGKTYRNGCITGFGCRHKLIPYRKGTRPTPIPAAVVEKQRRAEETQRRIERRIRYEKERAALLSQIDAKEARKSRLRAKSLSAYYRAFSERSKLAAVPTRLRTMPGEDLYKRKAPEKERKKYGI